MLSVRITPEQARAWIDAASGPIADELAAVYLMARDAIEARSPACWASGRCCNFEQTGHLLFVTGLEAAFTLSKLDVSQREALQRWSADLTNRACPFQMENLCGAHAIKPLGCRVYFCDRDAQDWQHELSERALESIRAIHARHGLDYVYAEWRGLLRAMIG
jgi:Fe-S-cluster containining protein